MPVRLMNLVMTVPVAGIDLDKAYAFSRQLACQKTSAAKAGGSGVVDSIQLTRFPRFILKGEHSGDLCLHAEGHLVTRHAGLHTSRVGAGFHVHLVQTLQEGQILFLNGL